MSGRCGFSVSSTAASLSTAAVWGRPLCRATGGEADLPASDPDREARQIERLRRLAVESGMDPDFAEKFLAFIIREVIRHHEAIAAKSSEENPA